MTARRAVWPWLGLFITFASGAVFGLSLAHGVGGAMWAYLAAFAFAFSTALGGLVLLMISHAAGARWFIALRRLSEAIAVTAPLLALLFLPIALTLRALYPWARELDGLDEGERRIVEHIAPWLSAPWFLARAALYLAVWVALAELLRRWSLAEDRAPNQRADRRQRALSAVGLPLVLFSGSFAVFDWLMSSVPGWNLNILGVYVLSGGFGAAVGVMTIGLYLAKRSGLLPAEVSSAHVHALGRLLLTAVCLWAYLAACQLVIVWSANLPSEAGFYLARFHGPFRVLALTLAVGHFAVPFLILLSRDAKRSAATMALLGGWIVLMHAIDLYWLVAAGRPRSAASVDAAPFVLVLSLLVCFGTFRFRRAPPFPRHAAALEQSLAYESS